MKNVLVTGATDGIGQETARQLLHQGWHVLVHGRNEAKATSTVADISRSARRGKATPVWGDFAQMQEIVTLAEQIAAHVVRLDVLINNAGVYKKERCMTKDGFEMTMAINHFAPFLLTTKLMKMVEQAPEGRIVVVSSMTHKNADLDPDDLELSRNWSGYDAYATSKLANILFTKALAKRKRSGSVVVNSLHPGVIRTKLLRASFGNGGGKVQDGAKTSVFLSTSPEIAGITGEYFVDCQITESSQRARDTDLAEALWSSTETSLINFL